MLNDNPYLRFHLAAVDLNIKLGEILNGGILTFKLLIWDH
jgi:hypothetical protein